MSDDKRQNEGDSGDHEHMPEGEETPPAGVKTMAVVRWAILVAVAFVAVLVWGAWARERMMAKQAGTAAVQAPKYHCPMHPQVVSNEPGECPICHMDLVPISAERAAPAPAKPLVIVDDAGPLTHWCPMDREVRSARPGKCPICKMALEPIPDGGLEEASAHAAADRALPTGTTPIQLSLDRIQAIGVRTALAEEGPTSAALRVTAVVQPPEQGAAEVHVRTPGFVEAIHVDQTGKHVSAGQTLVAVYSPEILQAEHELLATRAWSGDASVGPGAARNKLALLGMTGADVERVLASREAIRAIAVVAPRAGFVTKKNVVLGSYVTPEMVLYEIQDLTRVYVVADVFLRDVPHVSVGSEARFSPSGRPKDVAIGKIDLVYPLLNGEARTRRVRMQLTNEPSRSFAPGEFGMLEIGMVSRSGVTIPRDALVDTGTATYVFVVEREGRFVPRSVVASGAEGDRVVIGEGLQAGDRVVSGATFLIDSESRLQASVAQGMTGTASSSVPASSSACETQFDRSKFPDKVRACLACEQVHKGMGSMVDDCKNAIPKPWK